MYCLALIATVTSLFLINASLFASDTDDRIESTAKQSYVFKTYLKGDDIDIQAKDGVVTLTGTVSEESHIPLARETLASMPGVKSVDNKLEVKDEASATGNDMWLVNKVKFTLFFHRNVSAAKTEISAKEGVVTLRGEASSLAQKDLTAEYAKDVDGVKDVQNEMTVATTAGGKTMGEKMENIGETIDDMSITAMVKTTLMYHRSTSALKTTVVTKDGVVTLGGTAKSAAEKALAAKFVSDVHGVKKVINNMTVG